MRRHGFTLLEVVLAIGLTAAVLMLLMTAINLYLVRVDADRTRIESAQLARTLLTMMADDLRAARYDSPANTNNENSIVDTSTITGIFGTATELRVDRSARFRWERTTREVDFAEETSPRQMPQSVRYYIAEGDDLSSSELAATGIRNEPLGLGYAGLYRDQSASIEFQNRPALSATSQSDESTAELLAPEVLEIEFAYYDGQQLLSEWDSAQNQGLPQAVEIRLTVLTEPFEIASKRSDSDRNALRRSPDSGVTYRSLVAIPRRSSPQTADSPRVLSTKNKTLQQP